MPTSLRHPRMLFFVAAAILLAVGGWGVYAASQTGRDSDWVLRTAKVLQLLDDVATLERQAVAAQRGYLLTRDGTLRDEFWDTKARVALQATALRESVEDAEADRAAAELEPLLARRMELAARTVGLFESDGLAAAQAFIAANGTLAMDHEIRRLLAAVRAREQSLLAERRRRLDRSAGVSMLATALGIPLSLGMLVIVNGLLVRRTQENRRIADAAEASSREFRKLSGDMQALSRFAGMLQSCESLDELLAITAQGFSAMAPGLAGTVYLLRASRDHAEASATWGRHAVETDGHPEPGDCWALRRNQPYACANVATDIPCPHVRAGGDAATLCLPLSAQGDTLGWITLSRSGTGAIEGDVVMQAAEQLSLALGNLRLQQDLRNQSIRDPLTGLFNRRYLEESLAREISRCTRRDMPLVVLMFDVDHFKAFNDRHGHPGGDTLLAAFGQLLQQQSRPEDIACRFGGEEFTVILPEASLDVGVARAEAIREATEKLRVLHHGVVLTPVTTSIGVAELPRHGAVAAELVAAADRALYRAKASGRNRVVVADDVPGAGAGAP